MKGGYLDFFTCHQIEKYIDHLNLYEKNNTMSITKNHKIRKQIFLMVYP